MLRPPASVSSPGYQIFMLALCLYSLGILAFQASNPDPSTVVILDYADFAVCVIFLADFMNSLVRATNRWRNFFTWGWLDLLSSVPAFDIARWGRAGRILRVFRVLRGLKVTQIMATLVMKKRAENAILAGLLVALILVTFCSIAVLNFEIDPDANIKSAEDAIWWAFATITTIGLSDRYPISSEGRLIAVLLMSAGVGLFGILSGFLASWFIGEDEESTNAELIALKEEIAMLRGSLAERR